MQNAGNVRMPIKGTPYKHQRDAFEFACYLFGLTDSYTRDEHAEQDEKQDGRWS